MAARRDTKGMFAAKLEEMTETQPLSKVRVSDLCWECDVERRVFYYHFKDKYDLVAWMFARDYLSGASGTTSFSQELYIEMHRSLWERRAFYRRALQEDTHHAIERHLVRHGIESNERALKRYLRKPTLSPATTVLIRHFVHGNVGCLIEWIRGEFEATPEQLGSNLFSCVPAELRDAYAEWTSRSHLGQ